MSTADNKEIVRAFVEAWNSKDLDRFDDLMSEDCRLTVGGATISCSPAATRAIAEHWLAGFPDYRFELLDLIAEGDKVVAGGDRPVGARERDRDLSHRGREDHRGLGGVRRARHATPARSGRPGSGPACASGQLISHKVGRLRTT